MGEDNPEQSRQRDESTEGEGAKEEDDEDGHPRRCGIARPGAARPAPPTHRPGCARRREKAGGMRFIAHVGAALLLAHLDGALDTFARAA